MRAFVAVLAVAAVAAMPGNSGNQVLCPGASVATPGSRRDRVPSVYHFRRAVRRLKIHEVLRDLVGVLTDSKACWPADKFEGSAIGQSYGGLFIRLAWHCSGSYRKTDGAGGCAGGRMRFNPEASWPDNANLDKARALLLPTKRKYGAALSWGDLYVLAGTAAIMHMGGPVGEVCVGRIDDADGTASEPLGPGPRAPACPVAGNCPRPLGSAQIGLIYVNPEGFMGEPKPAATAPHIREVFDRMGMNDSETVALIGGGHAFGKSHGACTAGAEGPPYWRGRCGTGQGADTFTSGIEGQWTSDPLKWNNQYFQLLHTQGANYVLGTGPGGAHQWSTPAYPNLMMQTTDVALVHDAKYKEIVKQFATKPEALDKAFAAVWAKLVTQGRGWLPGARRCVKPRASRFMSPRLRK